MSAIGMTVIKSFLYRGSQEEWSNHYHLTGTVPADAAAWRTLFDALVLQEKTLYKSGVTVVAGYGYDDDAPNAHAVWSVDLTISPNSPVAGTLVGATGLECPGDAAMWMRFKLDRVNTNGKAIYLRKYYHGVCHETSNFDQVVSTQRDNMNAFATVLTTGAGVDGSHLRDTGGASIVNHGVSNYVTTRSLKRRGKRPPTG